MVKDLMGARKQRGTTGKTQSPDAAMEGSPVCHFLQLGPTFRFPTAPQFSFEAWSSTVG